MSRTTKPCPGCGTIDSCRSADSVCDSCTRKLAFYDELMARQAEQVEDKRNCVVVAVPWADHGYPSIPHSTSSFGDDKPTAKENLQNRVRTLALELSEAAPGTRSQESYALATCGKLEFNWRDPLRLMLPGVAECLRTIYDSAHAIAEEAYAEGHRDGRSLLMQLRDGKLTPDEVEERISKVVAKAGK